MVHQRSEPGPGQEPVWDYLRPPRVEETTRHVKVVFHGGVIADTRRERQVLETSHPPVCYIPPEDVRVETLTETGLRTGCEWKGQAGYYSLSAGGRQTRNTAWSYPKAVPGHGAVQRYVAFYPGKMDACCADGERVQAQPGDSYGGWIASEIVGPYKGGPGSVGW